MGQRVKTAHTSDVKLLKVGLVRQNVCHLGLREGDNSLHLVKNLLALVGRGVGALNSKWSGVGILESATFRHLHHSP
jgi:hypothetical protein